MNEKNKGAKRKNSKPAAHFIRGRFYMLYILPVALGFALFYALPFLASLYFIFFEPDGAGGSNRLNGFAETLSNPAFLLALKNTLFMLFLFVFAMALFSLAMSYAIFRFGQRFARMGRTLIGIAFLPYIVPSVSVVALWFFVFDGSGLLGLALRSVSGSGLALGSGPLAPLCLMLVFLWKYAGINIVILAAAFAFVPKETVETARMDGCGEARLFFSVVLPQAKKQFYFTVLLSIMGLFGLSDEIYAIWGAYPPQSLYTLHNFMTNTVLKMEYYKSITAALVFAALVALLAALYMAMEKRWDA